MICTNSVKSLFTDLRCCIYRKKINKQTATPPPPKTNKQKYRENHKNE